MVKVRFAPSPTGIPHVGNIRTALFDYFLAKSTHGEFILRLEDTDQARKVEGAEEIIKEGLVWLGAQWDSFVVQSERLEEYRKYAKELVEKGIAREEEGAIRFIVNKEGSISWIDAIGNKEISYELSNVEDFIILKADGYPTYHLANVVDDHLMGITHVIRVEDWIPSTPKHLLLYKAFGWEAPIFAHVPNVMGTDGKKLSKRRGAKGVLDFKKEGFLSEALLNYLMLLGWSPKDDREVLSKEEISQSFTLGKVNSSPSIFDERKLLWMNGEYLRQMSAEDLGKRLIEFDPSSKDGMSDDDFVKFVRSAQTTIKTLADFKPMVVPFFQPIENKTDLLKEYASVLGLIPQDQWNSETIIARTVEFMQNGNIKFPQIYQDLTGQKSGLPLGEVFEILGRDKTIAWLK